MTEELKKYLLEQCRAWMLPEELNALRRTGLTELGEESTRKTALGHFKMEKMFGFQDLKTNELVMLGKEKMELAIVERLLKDSAKEVINNCPKCHKLTRTPKARQCRHCGNIWH